MVVDTVTAFKYFPLLDDGLAFRIDSRTALAFSMSFCSSKEA
jgi:hypothetical protein